ncbi:molecular chaperone [Cupriavidus pauculus]|uniref:fimbrial biogenesis chaperone n=1 Tax=Cupriavidus pauculus TaxID=82633 RepID=UPI001EE2F456|nr:molecular chaperone [Cupriavidus pauculus]GJG98153.1 fimbria/pilus periplasmic chaperone [Cupriavidus pauculus]
MSPRQPYRAAYCAAWLAIGIAVPMYGNASIVISGTRVVYNAGDRETTIKLTNEGKSPSLAQVWIDKGEENEAPSSIDAPFMVSPPIARIDPGTAQTLRIAYTGEALAQEVETVFWLNVLDIPPKSDEGAHGANKIQLAFRSRIKLFFRPSAIRGRSIDAPDTVQWKLVPGGIEAKNPSAYHVSFAAIEVAGGNGIMKARDGGMVPPGGTKVFPLEGVISDGPAVKVRFHAINDYGGAHRNEVLLE